MNNEDVSIITVNYNGLSDTKEFLDSIFLSGYSSCEIIVIDNGSSEDDSLVIKKMYPGVIVVRNEDNLGFAGGNNLGINVATGKYLLFLNNDTIITPRFIEPMLERIDSDPMIGMVCPKILYSYAPDTIQSTGFSNLSKITLRNHLIGEREKDLGQYQTAREIPFAHGAAMLVKKKVIDEVGLMPESYFLYYEELDWCLQIRKAGYTLWYEPQSHIFHKESASTGRLSGLKNYYMTRNRILFAKRNLTGLYRSLSLSYQLFIAFPKNVSAYLIKWRFDLAKSTILGVYDGFIKM